MWAIDPAKGRAALDVLELHAAGGSLTAEQIRARTSDRKPIAKSGDTIAVLPLYGVVAQRMTLMSAFSGGTSTEAFADDFDAAMADDGVSTIVFDCDSPGGDVEGVPELAARIRAARGKGKKLVAVANTTMASAAYWICSACDEIVASPSSIGIGSIGVFTVHRDESGLNEQLGLTYTLISAGEHKTDGNPYEPLAGAAKAYTQSMVDEMYGLFVRDVATQRGVSTAQVGEQFGQGRAMTAKQALKAGLIDRIATLEQTLTKLGAKGIGASGRPRQRAEASGTLRADGDPTPDVPTMLCPGCGAPLDDEGACTADEDDECTYRAAPTPEPDLDDDNTETDPTTSARTAGAARVLTLSPDWPDVAKEHDVSDNVPAAAAAAAILSAERKRATEVRALCKLHSASDELTEQLIAEGATPDAAASRILGEVRHRAGASPRIAVGADREAEKPFANVGEQVIAIVNHSRGMRDVRLSRVNQNAMRVDRTGATEMFAGTTAGMNESVGSEGGFFIAPEVLPGVIDPVYEDDPLLSRVSRMPIGSETNRTVQNIVDESSRTDGNRWGGIQFLYGDEGDTAAGSKPKMRQLEQLLKKIFGLIYLTDELVSDAPAAQAVVSRAIMTELQFMLSSEIYRGKGGGHITGFLNGKGGVGQAIEATQAIANSDQFLAKNVTKMLVNIPAALWRETIFLYNQELLPFFVTATIGGNTSVPLFIGAGGMANKTFDTILGKPAFVSELCEAVGTPGDIIAIAPSQYQLAEKGGAQIATSLHFKFDTDQLTLRVTYRADGKPMWNTTVTPFKGTSARGFFSTLNVRT